MSRRPLLIVDGDSYAHRAYHALPPITGAGDRPINAMVGVTNLILALWAAESPRAVLVCWDTGGVPTYRNELWPAYQSGREFDPEIVEQLDRLPGMIEALGFASAKEPGYEADDLLAAAAMAEVMDGGTALCATSDRDAYQLVSAHVTVLAPQTGGKPPARIDPAEVVARYRVEPEQVPDFIALRGDPSDKLPGAVGIGEKTAADLLLQYGTLDNLIAHADELKPRHAEAIREPNVQMFRRIAQMDVAAPVTLPPDGGLDRPGAAAFAREIGADVLAARIENG
jgi:DNA polymerase I